MGLLAFEDLDLVHWQKPTCSVYQTCKHKEPLNEKKITIQKETQNNNVTHFLTVALRLLLGRFVYTVK